jgi:hypothetical protein
MVGGGAFSAQESALVQTQQVLAVGTRAPFWFTPWRQPLKDVPLLSTSLLRLCLFTFFHSVPEHSAVVSQHLHESSINHLHTSAGLHVLAIHCWTLSTFPLPRSSNLIQSFCRPAAASTILRKLYQTWVNQSLSLPLGTASQVFPRRHGFSSTTQPLTRRSVTKLWPTWSHSSRSCVYHA